MYAALHPVRKEPLSRVPLQGCNGITLSLLQGTCKTDVYVILQKLHPKYILKYKLKRKLSVNNSNNTYAIKKINYKLARR